VKILALDTATENCSAALLVDGSMRAREVELERGHAERILPMIDDLLSEGGITLHDLDAIAFGRGPGSFTGVRLAATVTQGLAFGADLGVVPISDVQAVAQRALGTDALLTRVLVCNDARMREVYWGCFERGADGLARIEGEEHVSKPSEVTLPASWPTATAVGRGFAAYGDALRAILPTVSLTVAAAPSAPDASAHALLIQLLPRATEIALLAVPSVTAGHLVPPEAATPVYLRDNVAHVAHAPKPPGQAR
jgi:tRNA threonylcarbamoyladenosine biosynthesis protein TsaB